MSNLAIPSLQSAAELSEISSGSPASMTLSISVPTSSESLSSGSFANLKIIDEKLVEQASTKTGLNLANARLKKLTEHIHVLEETVRNRDTELQLLIEEDAKRSFENEQSIVPSLMEEKGSKENLVKQKENRLSINKDFAGALEKTLQQIKKLEKFVNLLPVKFVELENKRLSFSEKVVQLNVLFESCFKLVQEEKLQGAQIAQMSLGTEENDLQFVKQELQVKFMELQKELVSTMVQKANECCAVENPSCKNYERELLINNLQGKLNLGTTVVAVKFSDGVVFAADSKVTRSGDFVTLSESLIKIFQLTGDLFCGVSGSYDSDEVLLSSMDNISKEMYRTKLTSGLIGVPGLAGLRFAEKLENCEGIELSAILIEVNHTVMAINTVRRREVDGNIDYDLVQSNVGVIGSGKRVACISLRLDGILTQNFQPADISHLTEEEVVNRVFRAVEQASTFDWDTGGDVNLLVVRRDGSTTTRTKRGYVVRPPSVLHETFPRKFFMETLPAFSPIRSKRVPLRDHVFSRSPF